jgi:hypothetical protein
MPGCQLTVLTLMKLRLLFVLGVASLLWVPAPATAAWVASPYVGPTFGVEAGVADLGGSLSGQSMAFGGSFGYFGPAGFGLEADFGYSPNFFEGDSFLDSVVDSHVTTLMANAVIGGPRRGSSSLRPYASGGFGLINSRIRDAFNIVGVDENSLGLNVGGGIMGFFSDQVGLRADVRYFRSVRDDQRALGLVTDDLGFWRTSLGVSFRF